MTKNREKGTGAPGCFRCRMICISVRFYRKNEKHYGSKVLKETSKYLLKNLKEVNQIELRIKEINKGSIKCAEKAGFKLTKEKNSKIDSKIMIYRMNK